MTENTREAVRAILATDSTVAPSLAAAALKLLAGEGGDNKPLPRLVRTAEAIRLFGVTRKTLCIWAEKGFLAPVYAGKTRCRLGYTSESVQRMLEGKGGKADKVAANRDAARLHDLAARSGKSKRRA